MDKNSENFFKELAALLEKYDAKFAGDCNGDLQFYVGKEEFDPWMYADAKAVRSFLAVNQ
jgi:hypothetical protein